MAGFTSIKRLTVEEAKSEFKRVGTNVEKLDDYVDTLRGMQIGEAITVRIQEQQDDGKYVSVVPDTADADGDVDTVRMFKRRMSAAATSLGFKLKWKNKGHRTGEGENARYVLDWLSALAVETTAKDADDEETEGNGSGK